MMMMVMMMIMMMMLMIMMMMVMMMMIYIYITRSLGALRAPTSSWGTYGPLDFVVRALRALRPCDPRLQEGRHLFTNTYSPPPIHHHLFTITYSPKFSYSSLAGWRERERADDDERSATNTRHTMTAICKSKCDEYIRIFEYSNICDPNIYSDIRSYHFLDTNIFGYSFVARF